MSEQGRRQSAIEVSAEFGFGLGSEQGQAACIKFQDAAVRRPILSVGESTGAGNMVLFDAEESVILPKGSPAIDEIRKILRLVKNKLPMRKEKHIYTLDAWVEPSHKSSKHGFGR